MTPNAHAAVVRCVTESGTDMLKVGDKVQLFKFRGYCPLRDRIGDDTGTVTEVSSEDFLFDWDVKVQFPQETQPIKLRYRELI